MDAIREINMPDGLQSNRKKMKFYRNYDGKLGKLKPSQEPQERVLVQRITMKGIKIHSQPAWSDFFPVRKVYRNK